MDTIFVVLISLFIVIFLATAVLTLCALPGWIKIPDNYFKTLFYALILEVISCVFMVFNIVKPTDNKSPDALSLKNGKDWVLLDLEGHVSQLHVNDTLKLGMHAKEFSQKARATAVYILTKTEREDANRYEYLIMNDSAICIGKISEKSMNALNLFDEINLKQNTFLRITFVYEEGEWKMNDETLPDSWSLKLGVTNTSYNISDKDSNVYDETVKGFDKGKRKLHSFRGSDNAFYLVRITDADNSSSDKTRFITFIVIRTEIESKLNEKK
jgi:hypothetical protein